jgi:hypothetical protein
LVRHHRVGDSEGTVRNRGERGDTGAEQDDTDKATQRVGCRDVREHGRSSSLLWLRRYLDPPHQKQDDEDDDDERGTATKVVIAGAEALAPAGEEQDDEDVHDVEWEYC